VIDVHADDLFGPGDEMAVQPHLGSIVDAGKVQLVGAVAHRASNVVRYHQSRDTVLRDVFEHVHAVVRIRDGAVGPECLNTVAGIERT